MVFPMDGYPSSHIVKPEGARFPGIAGNEHTCMELARRNGLEAAETEVRTFGEHRALVVKRFDRKEGGGKIHQEGFCQALGRTGKYRQDPDGPSLEELFTKGPAGGWTLWDQVMFAWLIGDEDKHAKNFSVLYPEDGGARLSLFQYEDEPGVGEAEGAAGGVGKCVARVILDNAGSVLC